MQVWHTSNLKTLHMRTFVAQMLEIANGHCCLKKLNLRHYEKISKYLLLGQQWLECLAWQPKGRRFKSSGNLQSFLGAFKLLFLLFFFKSVLFDLGPSLSLLHQSANLEGNKLFWETEQIISARRGGPGWWWAERVTNNSSTIGLIYLGRYLKIPGWVGIVDTWKIQISISNDWIPLFIATPWKSNKCFGKYSLEKYTLEKYTLENTLKSESCWS